MKYLFMLLPVVITAVSCSKNNLANLAPKDETLQEASAAREVNGETETIIVSVQSTGDTSKCFINPDAVVCNDAFQTADAGMSRVIVKAGGVNTQDDPMARANLQTVLNKITVKRTVTSSVIAYQFISNATKNVLKLRRCSKTAVSNVYLSSALKEKSSLTAAMLANAAGSPTDANIAAVLTEVFDATNIKTSINK
jgi:hypothetical protein